MYLRGLFVFQRCPKSSPSIMEAKMDLERIEIDDEEQACLDSDKQ